MKKLSAQEFIADIEDAIATGVTHFGPTDMKRIKRLKGIMGIIDWSIDDALDTLKWLVNNKHKWRNG